MRAKFQTESPDEISMTLTMTMPLGQWKKLRSQLAQDWPSWDVGRQISDMVRQAEEKFYPTSEE